MAKVFVSSVIHAPINTVWNVIRDFNGLSNWTPFVVDSHIEEGMQANQVGCIRNFNLQDGGNIRERLLSLSDYDMTFTYEILESPFTFENYVATLSLIPITDGDETFAQWTAKFDTSPDQESHLINFVGQNVFSAAFESLNKRFHNQ